MDHVGKIDSSQAQGLHPRNYSRVVVPTDPLFPPSAGEFLFLTGARRQGNVMGLKSSMRRVIHGRYIWLTILIVTSGFGFEEGSEDRTTSFVRSWHRSDHPRPAMESVIQLPLVVSQ